MSSKVFIFLVLAVLVASCEKEGTFTVKNPLDTSREDEVIILTRSQIAGKTEVPEGKLPVFEANEKEVPSQADDLDGDGKWDEAALLVNLKAGESLPVEVDFIEPDKYPVFEKRTNLRLGITQPDGSFREVDEYLALPCSDGFEIISQAEGVNWENDKMGFRVYFDCRNVKDLFGKLKPGLIIDKVQTPELGSYHELADWGMDVLHCGSSLGSGGLALLRNDSLFRLGSTRVYKYRKIVEGPVRSVFELQYSGWHVENDSLDAVERISIYPGKYWFRSDVIFNGIKPGDEIVTGIVTSKLKKQPFEFEAHGYKCIGTHDVQSLNNDELGMAVLLKASEAGKVGRTTDIDFFALGDKTVVEKSFSNTISQTYYVSQKCTGGVPSTHYFAAVWGLEKQQWKTESGFREYLDGEMLKWSAPPDVK